MPDKTTIQRAVEAIRSSKQIAVLTGAGVSRESGVPTFREAQDGLWEKYDPQELATPEAFARNPKLVWDWYSWRRELAGKAKPNPGHYALAELEKLYPKTVVITQNVDDLHEQAGSRDVVHLHGEIERNKCFADCQGDGTRIDITTLKWDQEQGPPACPHCGQPVRPAVVWFGENLPQDKLARAVRVSLDCDLMIVVGTAGLVTPAASLPFHAREKGATLLEVNPTDSAITPITHIKLDAPSGEALPYVIEALRADHA